MYILLKFYATKMKESINEFCLMGIFDNFSISEY